MASAIIALVRKQGVGRVLGQASQGIVRLAPPPPHALGGTRVDVQGHLPTSEASGEPGRRATKSASMSPLFARCRDVGACHALHRSIVLVADVASPDPRPHFCQRS